MPPRIWSSRVIRSACGVAVLLVAASSLTAFAGVRNIGGGWQAAWDDSLDPYVDINSNGVVGDAVFIQKSAEFTQPPGPDGLFPTIPIVFTQIAPNAVHAIVIEDEIITNSTGHPWTDFHMDLLDHNDATFDPARTLVSGGPPPIGFSIAPFTNAAFAEANHRLNIDGGLVPAGGHWFPGSGVSDGELWIAVNPHAETPFTTFVLKETPTPEPASLVLLALGGLILRRRG